MFRICFVALSLVLANMSLVRGGESSYKTLGDLPLLHDDGVGGRRKPLDTYARLAVRQVYGREVIKTEPTPELAHKSWDPLTAFRDWTARPEAWDEQEIVLIDLFDYRPFKQRILASVIQKRLELILAREGTSGEIKELIEPLLRAEAITERQVEGLVTRLPRESEDRKELARFARMLGEGRKWIAPAVLEEARVKVGDRSIAFFNYVGELMGKAREATDGPKKGKEALSSFERRALEVGERWLAYQAFRDGNPRGLPSFDMNVVPRPANAAYLKFTATAVETVVKRQMEGLTPLQESAVEAFQSYVADIRGRDRKMPGTDAGFDAKYTAWVAEKSPWISVRLLMSSSVDELESFGYDRAKVEEFRAAWTELESSEKASTSGATAAAQSKVVEAARALADMTGSVYPARDVMGRETFYNRLAPFGRAPWFFGAALVLFLISMGITAKPGSWMQRVDWMFYGLGWLAFVGGIVIEAVGFYYRVRISGWAPVTNMYETVIWVAFMCTVFALVLELIYRRKSIVAAGSGVAFLATLLAANVSLLDPMIREIPPVLQSNYWLTVHVITIVTSYAAFALAMGLGLLATGYYLTATYGRRANPRKMIAPVLLGIPLLACGLLALAAPQLGSAGVGLTSLPMQQTLFGLAMLGIVCTGAGISAWAGEVANRSPKRVAAGSVGVILAGLGAFAVIGLTDTPDWWPLALPQEVLAGLLVGAGVLGLCLSVFGWQNALPLHRAAKRGVNAGVAEEESLQAANRESKRVAAAGRVGDPGHENEGGNVALLERPSVSEIRERARLSAERGGGGSSEESLRIQAMRATSERIKPIANFIYRAMQVGVLLVAAGTILGGVWADDSWGRFWGWDPKEVWALITLLVYLVPLHGRFAGWVNTFGLVGSSVVCFASVLMAWYGVNFVLGVGLHSYGFTEGGGQGVVIATSLAVASLYVGAWWRRRDAHTMRVAPPAS
jgi:ABC-type transport system involved in cytochrome c biogenesis permease subunit